MSARPAGLVGELLPAVVPTRAVRRLAAVVLTAEAFVVFFAVLVAVRLRPEQAGAYALVGAGLAVGAALLCGLLRHRWAYQLGWILQLGLIATGLVLPVMFALGVIFALLWAVAIRTGSRQADR